MHPCDKHTAKSPCEGEVSTVVCLAVQPELRNVKTGLQVIPPRPCEKKFTRCHRHGGAAGAQRSLTGHRTMYHPKESR